MPTARTKIDVAGTEVPIEIEFQMWCGVCRAGICGSTTYNRNTDNEFTVTCPDCEKERASKEQELEETIEELRQQVQDLEDEVLQEKESQ